MIQNDYTEVTLGNLIIREARAVKEVVSSSWPDAIISSFISLNSWYAYDNFKILNEKDYF